MHVSKIPTSAVGFDKFVVQAGPRLHEIANELVESTLEHLNHQKTRRIALQERIAFSARQLFPNIEPYIDPTNKTSDKLSTSNQTSILRLNIGGKHVNISRSTLTQIQGSKLAFLFSGKWDEVLPRDKDGRIFMDFDASWLEPILDHLRNLADSSVHVPSLVPGDQPYGVILLLQYLNLESLFVVEPLYVSPDQWTAIKSWIPNLRPDQSTPELIFKGSLHGFTAESFHSMCDGVPDTVTIVQDMKGSVFGGYADVAWSSAGEYVESDGCFLFSISVRGTVNPQVCRMRESRANEGDEEEEGALRHSLRCMASFGPDLCICCDCRGYGSDQGGFNYYHRPDNESRSMTGDDFMFRVAEIEVYRYSSTLPKNEFLPRYRSRHINNSRISLPESVKSTQSSMNNFRSSYNSFFEIMNEFNRQYRDLECYETYFNDQFQFLQTSVDPCSPSKFGIACEERFRPCDRIINFIVGGTIFLVSVGILSLIPESMLWSGYASGRWRAENHVLDDDGNIFLDHDPSNFATLITFLRVKSMIISMASTEYMYVCGMERSPEIHVLSRRLLKEFDNARMINFRQFLEYFQVDFDSLGMFGSCIVKSDHEIYPLLLALDLTFDKLIIKFRGSRDGFTAATFHSKCYGIGDVIVIVRDTNGSVFGGYGRTVFSKGFCLRNKKYSNSLFSLSIRGVYNFQFCYSRDSPEDQSLADKQNMVELGESLLISDCCNQNTLNYADFDGAFEENSNSPYFLPERSNNFQVDEIEAWCVNGRL